jgi:hypothetical protein
VDRTPSKLEASVEARLEECLRKGPIHGIIIGERSS